jgi:hypothetical protein
MFKKLLFVNFLITLFAGVSISQIDPKKLTLEQLQIFGLRSVDAGASNRIAYIYQGYIDQYVQSVSDYKTANWLLSELFETHKDNIDTIFYHNVLESIQSELKITRSEIDMKGFGSKVPVKWNDEVYKLTEEQIAYITYLILLSGKAIDKSRELNEQR